MEEKLEERGQPTIQLEPVIVETLDLYCKIGEQAYRDHYLHLWPDQDPSPYIENSFRARLVQTELVQKNNLHYLVRSGATIIGIAKLVLNKNPKGLIFSDPVFLEKIYLLKEYTGKGYGPKVLSTLHDRARQLGMGYICLSTMQKGRALSFYLKMGYEILREEVLPFENAIPEEKGMYLLGRSLK
ncbi:GNAT family N-acetyltransferase [Muriicola marianensis]|uniref:N-acetyltransferase domain-containing protein n=1 Tax=Muriicola marianensis TaxID=1324801 RepID=A0ABQ1R5V0_9FLAO|nr:GNAT family N-acetyltransferase [Muriicola marianensis]GGD56778.1 hypothetical protein GCM10011361_24150 [Muriicola marianensis]